jgi:hypothetical protein
MVNFRAIFDGVLASILFAVTFMQAPVKKKHRRKKRKKRTARQHVEVATAESLFIEEDRTPAPKRARMIPKVLPRRFLAGDDVHFDGALSDRPALFVESDDGGPVYIVPRNEGSQIYIARNLACRHTVCKLSYAREYLALLPPKTLVRYYCPEVDHEDDFFMVLNKEETIRPLLVDFPFRELLEYSLQKGSVGELQVQRQSVKVNRSFTSSMSMGGRAINGVPQPALKKGSCDGVVVSAHLVASHIIATLPLPWLGRTVLPGRDRLQCARMISPENTVEASTFTLSTDCAWHRDKHNPSSTLDDLSWVMNINHVFANGETLAALFYQRRSVCAYLRASNVHDPLSDYFEASYLKFPVSRRTFSHLTITDMDIERDTIDRGGFLQRSANLDTLGFHNLFLISWITLVDRFQLNLLEAVSSYVAILFCPNTAEPFARATIHLLSGCSKTRCPRGFDFGFQLLELIAGNCKEKKFGIRFSTYRPVIVPSVDTYFGHCRLIFWTCIHVWSTYATKPPNKTIHCVYEKIKALLQEIPGVGDLTAMHGVQILSEMGLLPLWLQTFAAFNPAGKAYRRLAKKFGLGTTRNDAKKAMATLKDSLNKQIGPLMTEVIIENLSCKAGQLETASGKRVCDVHHRHAPVVQRCDDGMGLVLSTTEEGLVDLENGCLMSAWPFEEEILSMSAICHRLGTVTALKSMKGIRDRPMPAEAQTCLCSSPVPYQIQKWY